MSVMLFFESIPKKRRDFIRSFRESEVNTAPPSPVLNSLVAWNEVVEISPQEKIDSTVREDLETHFNHLVPENQPRPASVLSWKCP